MDRPLDRGHIQQLDSLLDGLRTKIIAEAARERADTNWPDMIVISASITRRDIEGTDYCEKRMGAKFFLSGRH